jgi:hypothetical protein
LVRDGDWHGHKRDQHGSPVLQEDQHHDPDERHRLEQGLHHVVHRFTDERRDVICNFVVHSVGKS